jgi:hypothetical protein
LKWRCTFIINYWFWWTFSWMNVSHSSWISEFIWYSWFCSRFFTFLAWW